MSATRRGRCCPTSVACAARPGASAACAWSTPSFGEAADPRRPHRPRAVAARPGRGHHRHRRRPRRQRVRRPSAARQPRRAGLARAAARPAHAPSTSTSRAHRRARGRVRPRETAAGRPASDLTRALLVHVGLGRDFATPTRACRAARAMPHRRASTSTTFAQRRPAADPNFSVGRGKLEEIILRAMQLGVDMVIFDHDLTPAQARSRERLHRAEGPRPDHADPRHLRAARPEPRRQAAGRARAAEVHIASPRRKNTMMSRLTGGIGGRGPGETKLEINRRRARERITRLESKLESSAAIARLRRQRRGQRRARRRHRRLHQRRQDRRCSTPSPKATRWPRTSSSPPSTRSAGACAFPGKRGRLHRYCRLHPRPPAESPRGVPRHPRRARDADLSFTSSMPATKTVSNILPPWPDSWPT